MNAEQAVLGAMLKSKDAAHEALDLLVARDFLDPANMQIFLAMDTLNRHESPIDLVTLDEQLTRWGRLDEVGGASYLVELARSVPDAENINAYIAIVLERSPRTTGKSAPVEKPKILMRIQFTDGGYADVDPEKDIIINAASIKAIRPITSDESEVET